MHTVLVKRKVLHTYVYTWVCLPARMFLYAVGHAYSVHEAQITVYFARFAHTLGYAYSALEAPSIRCSFIRTLRHVMCTVHMKPKAYLGF